MKERSIVSEEATKTYWKYVQYCRNKSRARIITVSNSDELKMSGDHGHVPDTTGVSARKVVNSIKEHARVGHDSTRSIISTAAQHAEPGVVPRLPDADRLARMVRRVRKSVPRVNPASAQDSRISDEISYLADGETFLQFDSGAGDVNRILVFASNKSLDVLQQSADVLCDGTFKICPAIFFQVYTVHVVYQGVVIPFVYALLESKSENNYVRLLTAIKQLVPNFNPLRLTIDFEKSFCNAFLSVFPGTAVHGCSFHMMQAIWRHIQATSSFRQMYTSSTEAEISLRMLGSLAFVPVPDVIHAYETLIQSV